MESLRIWGVNKLWGGGIWRDFPIQFGENSCHIGGRTWKKNPGVCKRKGCGAVDAILIISSACCVNSFLWEVLSCSPCRISSLYGGLEGWEMEHRCGWISVQNIKKKSSGPMYCFTVEEHKFWSPFKKSFNSQAHKYLGNHQGRIWDTLWGELQTIPLLINPLRGCSFQKKKCQPVLKNSQSLLIPQTGDTGHTDHPGKSSKSIYVQFSKKILRLWNTEAILGQFCIWTHTPGTQYVA